MFLQLIATIASCSNGAELEQWPELLPHLVLLLDAAAEPNRIHGAFSALSKICQDIPEALDSDTLGIKTWQINNTFSKFCFMN